MAEDILVYPGFTASDYDKDKWIATVNGSNSPFRVQMSEVLEARGVEGYALAEAAWKFPSNFRLQTEPSGYFFIGPVYGSTPRIMIINNGSIYVQATATGILQLDGMRVDVKAENTVASDSFRIENDLGAPTRIGLADTWAIYPSFALEKENLEPIDEPLEKSTQIRGYNFTQQEKEKGGFTVEDIEQHYPRALLLDDKGETRGYDPNCLLALLFESVRILEERVVELEAKAG